MSCLTTASAGQISKCCVALQNFRDPESQQILQDWMRERHELRYCVCVSTLAYDIWLPLCVHPPFWSLALLNWASRCYFDWLSYWPSGYSSWSPWLHWSMQISSCDITQTFQSALLFQVGDVKYWSNLTRPRRWHAHAVFIASLLWACMAICLKFWSTFNCLSEAFYRWLRWHVSFSMPALTIWKPIVPQPRALHTIPGQPYLLEWVFGVV